MLRQVLQSDVEFAQGMISSGHSDARILASLGLRGIEPPRAAQLVDDLRHGRKPCWEIPDFMSAAATRASTPPPRRAATPHSPTDSQHSRAYRRVHRRSKPAWWLLILVAIFIWAFAYAFLHLGSDASQDAVQRGKHEVPPAPNK